MQEEVKIKKEALQGVIIEQDDIKIGGVLSFSRVIPDVKWYAGNNKAGIVGAYDGYTQDIFKGIEEMKKRGRYIGIVSALGGSRKKH